MRSAWIAVAMAAMVAVAGCGAQKGPSNPGTPGGNYGNQSNQTQTQTQTQTGTQTQTQGTGTPAAQKKWSKEPDMQIDPNKTYTATIKTNMGDITVQLFAKDAPHTVNNFVFLARQKFYDGVIFHRIIKNFMIQTGDPLGTGSGGPGYSFKDELPVKRSYDTGIVAMANAGPNTNGSQFFICNGPGCKSLDQMPNYTQFGMVTGGLDVVQKISNVPVVANPSMPSEVSKPTNPPVIQTVVIDEK